MSSAHELLTQWINGNKVFVASKSYCPYCNRAKALLKELNVEAFIVELDLREDGKELQDELEKISGQRTVPNIYINQKHIGGNAELQALHSKGELVKLL
ncbi:glutaredoxin-1 [Trichomonascus vanleenenianus]|uniref:glutaredoxin n=1 Tax=Trichomonascus vanleenenianus TaxID=2268995 RepID=UPI003EC9D91A